MAENSTVLWLALFEGESDGEWVQGLTLFSMDLLMKCVNVGTDPDIGDYFPQKRKNDQ